MLAVAAGSIGAGCGLVGGFDFDGYVQGTPDAAIPVDGATTASDASASDAPIALPDGAPADSAAPPDDATIDASAACAWLPQGAASPTCTSTTACTTLNIAHAENVRVATLPASYTLGIAVDDTFVYFAAQTKHDPPSAGFLGRVPKTGGNLAILYQDPTTGPEQVAVDGDYVYFSQRSAVLRLPKSCNAPCPPPAMMYTGTSAITQLATAPSHVLAGTNDQSAFAVLADGGVLGKQQSAIYSQIVTDTASFYWASPTTPTIRRLSLDLSAGTPFANVTPFPDSGQHATYPGAWFLAADCTDVYAYAAGFFRFSKANPTTQESIGADPHPDQYAFAMTMDARHVYLGKPNTWGLWRIDKSGSSAAAIELSTADIWGLANDDGYVYFGDHGSGEIVRLQK